MPLTPRGSFFSYRKKERDKHWNFRWGSSVFSSLFISSAVLMESANRYQSIHLDVLFYFPLPTLTTSPEQNRKALQLDIGAQLLMSSKLKCLFLT